jgi:hypothetical protein
MATTNGNRKLLDLKRWEMVAPAPTATVAASCIISSRHYRQQQLYLVSATVAYLYNPMEDGWIALPSPGLGGAFAAGACGVGTSVGPSGTATAGTTSTLTTTHTLARDLRGYSVHITGGPNAGAVLPIVSNTIGANAVITVATQATAFTTSSTYRLLTPRFYVLNAITAAGNTTANLFKFYDFATNAWVAAETGATDGIAPAAVIGTDSRLISTPSWIDGGFVSFATGTATSATNTGNATITVTGKTWNTNQWSNYQVRITGGTGAGQVKSITSNTGSVLTLNGVFTTALDNTSTYAIEGNDDYIYYMGSNAVTLYRYSISAGTWTTLSPTAARGAAPSTGMSGHWVWGSTAADWTAETTIQNGRFIYSFRAGGAANLDRYDVALNTWATVTYSPAVETFTTGSKYIYNGDYLYIQGNATGRWFRYNFVTSEMDGWGTMLYPQGAALLGDTAFDVTYVDGTTEIKYNYMLLNTSNIMLRQMVV